MNVERLQAGGTVSAVLWGPVATFKLVGVVRLSQNSFWKKFFGVPWPRCNGQHLQSLLRSDPNIFETFRA
jgi:ABC-type Co2+ transport system permease subunit